VEDIPYTLNSKRVEVPVKKVSTAVWLQRGADHGNYQIINGAPISSVNPSTLRNPESLAAYAVLRDGILSLSQ